MSWRQIHSSVAVSESLSACSSDAERLFWRMLAQTDAWGRLDARPRKVRALCAPLVAWTDDHVAVLLAELVSVGRILVHGTTCQVVDFEAHQPSAARRRGESKFLIHSNTLQEPPGVVGSLPEEFGLLPPRVEESRGRGIEKPSASNKPSEPKGSAGLVVTTPSAQTLLGEYIDEARTHNVEVPRRVIGQFASSIKSLLDEGQTPDAIRAGLRRMGERGVVIPSQLAAFVLEAALPRRNGGNSGRVSPSQIMAHALSIEREEP